MGKKKDATRAEVRGNAMAEHHDLRDLSCLLRCSLLEKALLQNWHLYFFSGSDDFRICDDAAVGRTFMLAAAGIFCGVGSRSPLLYSLPHRPMVEIVWRAGVGVGFKVRLECVAV